METANPRSTKPRFLKDTKVILIKVHIGAFLEDQKSHFCHSAAKKICGSGNLLIWRTFGKYASSQILGFTHTLNFIWQVKHKAHTTTKNFIYT